MTARERRGGRKARRGADASAVARLRHEIDRGETGAAEVGEAAVVLAGFKDAFVLEQRGRGLQRARKIRDAIVVLVALLGELDDLDAGEPDVTSFAEVAGLFDDVGEFAACGATAMRQAASGSLPHSAATATRN